MNKNFNIYQHDAMSDFITSNIPLIIIIALFYFSRSLICQFIVTCY